MFIDNFVGVFEYMNKFQIDAIFEQNGLKANQDEFKEI